MALLQLGCSFSLPLIFSTRSSRMAGPDRLAAHTQSAKTVRAFSKTIVRRIILTTIQEQTAVWMRAMDTLSFGNGGQPAERIVTRHLIGTELPVLLCKSSDCP
jgi:hypothetical protein